MAAPELHDNKTLDDVTYMTTTHTRVFKTSNFSRWMTSFSSLDLLPEIWTIKYFTVAVIKKKMPSISSPCQYMCTLMTFMNTASSAAGAKVRKGQCPVLYVEVLFVRAFDDVYFARHFQWLIRCDPSFKMTVSLS